MERTFILLILALSLSVCQAQIRCYVCTTSTGPYSDKCGDNFLLTSVDSFTCSGTCQKTRALRSEGGRRVVEITRGCVTYQAEGCRKGDHLGVSADICTCNDHLCNNAQRPGLTSKQSIFLYGLVITLCHTVIKFL
ncbi:hypothetical protein ACF0H5_011049 [Mactra antiquata]